MRIDRENGINALYGGLLLGGGGGGSLEGGIKILDEIMKYGGIELHSADETEKDSVVVTASLVGSPASKNKFVSTEHYKKVYDLFKKIYEKPIQGIITNELGAQSVTNGWVLSALTGIPFIDAPCNGRAHPTGVMGSLSLSQKSGYVSVQACAGGKGEKEIETAVKGTLDSASKIIRNSAVEAGGFVTVLRNPVPACYVREHAAVGGIAFAVKIGSILRKWEKSLSNIICKLESSTGLKVICEGNISEAALSSRNGFDSGEVSIESGKSTYYVSFMNEYMTIEKGGERLATFPDLIVIFDRETALPVTSAEAVKGMNVVLAKIPKEKLILGSSMYDKKLFKELEPVLGKKITDYVFPERQL